MGTAELQEIVADLAKSTKRLEASQKETDRQMKETDRKIKGLSELFTGQWGKLVEALVDSGLPKLFRGRGIAVREVSRRHEIYDGSQKIAEIDVLLHNGGEDVAVEVKTSLRVKDVKEHLERLEKVRASVPSYSEGGKKLYGAVAGLKYDSEVDLYAERQGLFVLKSSEGIFEITNQSGFVPQER
jgi:hypothetical protein